MNMKVRDAELKDAGLIDELLTDLIHDESQYDSNLDNGCIVTENYCNRIGLDGHKILVAEDDGKIVGYIYGFIYQVPGIWLSSVAILDALYVDKNFRRRGCATLLFSKFKEFAKENGACRIELKVISNNKAAVELYNRFSFVEVKKYMNLEL
ncbi:MAG: GNAT family N-acetyltransferase [Oscillospiraceae bacterium]|nr:GNAT family N-acetyltransferase [Oscillospiraceae bacterium]